jgi:hypothetical protein
VRTGTLDLGRLIGTFCCHDYSSKGIKSILTSTRMSESGSKRKYGYSLKSLQH